VVPWWWWCSLRWPENDELGTHAGFGRRWDEIMYGMMDAGWVRACLAASSPTTAVFSY
jgi:hypothetical protein